MNATMLRFSLLALLTFCAPAAAQVRHSVDADVYQQIAAQLPPNQLLVDFDADWTADGKLAIAYVERQFLWKSGTWQDRLVIALHDPQGNTSRLLGEFQALSNWVFPHLSLAVPESFCAVPDPEDPDGPGLPVHDGNRVYVAITATAPSMKGASPNGYYPEWTRTVRLFSVSFTDPTPKLTLVAPPSIWNAGLVDPEAILPDAEVSVGTLANAMPDKLADRYVVDLVYIDPRSDLEAGHVMISRSWDNGASLEEPFYVTGPCSAAAASGNKSHPLVNSLFARPATFFDEKNGVTTLAFEDVVEGVIHVVQGKPESCEFELVFTTPKGVEAEAEPRLAVREGEINFTCLVGKPDAWGARDLEWYHGSANFGFQALFPLTDRALSPGDIQLHGSDAHIVVRALPDQGTKQARILTYETSRSDPNVIPTAVEVDDDGRELEWIPRAAASPEHRLSGTPFRFAALWQVDDDPASQLPRTILMDE